MRATGPPHVLFVVASADVSPSTTVRVHQYLPRLAEHGIRITELPYRSAVREAWHRKLITGHRRLRPALVRSVMRAALMVWRELYAGYRNVQIILLARRVDAVFIQKVLLPRWLLRYVTRHGTRLVYDFDDAVFLASPRRAADVVSLAWRVLAGSHFNLEFARRHNSHSVLLPSAVPIQRYSQPVRPSRSANTVRIGWIGSPWTMRYLEQVAEPLRRLAARGLPVSIVIVGSGHRPDLVPDLGIMPVEVVASYKGDDLPALVSRIDIGLMPLEDGPWERGKCAMKALVYMAGGCPAVCSPVGETNYVIEDRQTGFFASTPQEWESVLAELVTDQRLRLEVGARGRQVVVERYSTDVCFELLYDHVFAPLASNSPGVERH